jgi:L-lactate dehydrogenase
MQNTSIGIIGMGWVGASVAISTLQQGIATQLLVNDLQTDIAEGEAMDLTHGASFFPSAEVRAASVSDMRQCQAIVITAGRGGSPEETRLQLLKDNVAIARSLSEQLRGYEGLLIIVSNPVDVLTYFYQKYTGLPAQRVIGTGTFLDTVRLREMVGQKINLAPHNVHAQVLGEHGDSELVHWSRAMVGGRSLRSWPGWNSAYEEELESAVRNAAYEIIRRKGATNHAIGLLTAALLRSLLRDERRIIPLSTVIDGPFGLRQVALSLPALVTRRGIERLWEPELEPRERERFLASAQVLREAIQSVQT